MYIQDRRPSSNADPYKVTDRIVQTMILDNREEKLRAHSKETQTSVSDHISVEIGYEEV